MNMANKVPIVQATFYNNNTKQIENCYPMTSAKGVIMSDGKTLEESFSNKANDTNVVHKSGDEEILGRKTFDDLRANGFCLSDEGDWNRWVSAFYSFLEGQGIIQFGTEEDWGVILRNIADPEYENDAANKGYVDIKIGDASIPVLQYGVLINNDLPSILESKEQAIANAPIYAKILSGEVKFFAAKAGNDLFISSKIQITNGQANVTLLGLKVPSLTLHIVQMTIGQSGLSSKINLWMNLQSALSDTDGSYGQRVANLEKTKQETLTAGNGISIEGGVISSTVDSLITPTTYAELVALRNSSSLIAGMQYRITDYTCTTTQENTQSAGHPFDIIVTADSENTLNEVARAIQHEGDTYFADCDLNAWKIWYCLDNDATRFAWADSANGKGIIYRMIDEWNNDVPYDFKNIQFARDWSVIAPDSGLAGTIYCYTFSVFLDGLSEDATANDESVKAKECIESDGDGFFGNNKIASRNAGAYLLNDIIFFTDWAKHTVNHSYNTFGNDCYSNTFGNGCYSNTFGNDCYYNSFGNYCNYIKFAISSSATTKYNYYQHNHFGDGCQYILFKGAETASSSAQVQNYNFAQGLQGTSSEYLTIDGVRSRAYETKVAKNSSGELKIYCEADLIQ